jgi:tRNA threonylcarbamoyladenosine dehydratase
VAINYRNRTNNKYKAVNNSIGGFFISIPIVLLFYIFAVQIKYNQLSIMGIDKRIFQRTELLIGSKNMDKLANARVIIVGIGGVGSWCAESLIRSGIGHLTIVDSDRVATSNINRQLMATTQTIGQVKTEVLKKRLLEINPYATIIDIQEIYSAETHAQFQLENYHYIIDAIDSLSNKVHLIRMATRTKAILFSSMGASLRMDPTRVHVNEFWKVKGCPLAAIVRKRIKQGDLPAKKFQCVYSDEVLPNIGEGIVYDEPNNEMLQAHETPGNPELANHDWSASKARINGTTAHITAIFGFTLAGLVVQSVCKNEA